MTRLEFIVALNGADTHILWEPSFGGSVNATYGVRTIATYYPDGDARLYTNEDQYDYETYTDGNQLEDAIRSFIDHTPDDYFNDEDYVLDSVDQINAHD